MPKRTDIMLEKLLHPTMKLYYNVLTQPYSLRKFPSPNYFVLGNCPSVNNEWSLIKRLTKKKSSACFFILREKRNWIDAAWKTAEICKALKYIT